MKLISHRGNTNGKNPNYENNPSYIDAAISMGYDVEIDVYWKDGKLYTGHDSPQYEIDSNWLLDRQFKLWIHCKNKEAVEWFNSWHIFNFFWHESDTMTITSKGFLWVYPGKQPVQDSIAVLPEMYGDNVAGCYGVCSDFIENY